MSKFKVGDRVVYKETFYAEIYFIQYYNLINTYYYNITLEGTNKKINDVNADDLRYTGDLKVSQPESYPHGWVQFDTKRKIKVSGH